MTNSLEAPRIARALPGAELVTSDELGLFDVLEQGMMGDEADREVVVRALRKWGVESAVVAPDLPVAVADRLRGDGIAIDVDARAVNDRRRVKTPPELAGIRRAQRA